MDQQVKPINLLRGRVEVTGDQSYLSIHTQPAVMLIMLESRLRRRRRATVLFPVIRFSLAAGADRAIRLTSALANRKPTFP